MSSDETPDRQAAATGRDSTLVRAFRLLDAFDPEHTELSIRELATRSGLSRSAVHRLSTDLVSAGVLVRSTGGLKVGTKLFELGSLAPNTATLRELAIPVLHALHEMTRLTANLAILVDGEVLYVEKIGTPQVVVPHSRLGGRGALHATALGKAMLAFTNQNDEPPKERLVAMTPHTITDPDRLAAELLRIRESFIAFDLEESREGLFCVAAPILDPRGQAVAAISVTGATAQTEAAKYASTVRAAAQAIARIMSARTTRATRS